MSDDLSRIQSGDGSKFNSSLADLERIHNLLVACNQFSIVGDLPHWLGTLQSLDREISPYLNEKEEAEMKEKRVNQLPNDPRAHNLIANKLSQYEIKLRMFRSKKKLGIIAEDDANTVALR